MLTYAQRISVFVATAAALYAQSTAPNIPVTHTRTSGVVGLAQGQTARFNVLRPNENEPATVPCAAVLTYFDGAGKQLKSSTVTVAPGTVGYLNLDSDIDLALPVSQWKQIRVTVTVPLVPPPASSSTAVKPIPICRLIPTLEIFDELTGRTTVVLGGFHRIAEDTVTPAATAN
jgi:hypothetical protein